MHCVIVVCVHAAVQLFGLVQVSFVAILLSLQFVSVLHTVALYVPLQQYPPVFGRPPQ
jgi:hypothetical protein